ncbi:hypothetical protein PGT21_005363 [Puccinia graminis f. sp. tritici]|uniref:Methyltransferase-like protein 4 n=1 Tax=Puccinia graminis f. sp. tritici TaxID=56615 RepID=A0A5B0P671_PUCGR|nr:hypothetical protein PGT21_005363 [Puccinia graminis f. sp. tritici]KAA1104875.1 hypothetical protein PGTUg99_001547 [Puccinia graminis f. sp. tritici]
MHKYRIVSGGSQLAKRNLDQSYTKMSQRSEPSSVLLEILLPEKNLTAYLLDPFVPLLRGFDETTRVSVSRPPSEPHIICTPTTSASTTTNRENRPTKRQRSNNEPPSASGHSCQPGESAETSQIHPLNGFQLEAAHHASIKGNIQHAVDAIRERWIDECSRNGHSEWWSDPHLLRHPAVAQLEWLPSPEIKRSEVWVDWAALTRDTFQVRCKTQFDLNQSSTRVSESGITCTNSSSTSISQTFLPEKKCSITLPKRSGFSLATMENFKNEVFGLNHSPGWDAVIIDPPWQNKSATRGGKYRTVELYDLFKLDLPGILGENGGKRALIAVWVTNRPKYRRFLKNKFFPDCHVQGPYSEWYWVKITASPTVKDGQPALSEGGKPLFDLDSTSPRRCYEGLVLGWYIPPSLRPEVRSSELPPKIFLSVPLGHSRKPNIIDLLAPHLPSDPSILELFSRSVSGLTSLGKPLEDKSTVLSPMKGMWHSVGDESPKFNVAPWVVLDSSINTPSLSDP